MRVPRPSPYRRGRLDIAAWRGRVRQKLTTRFGLRLHMTLLLALVFACAFVTTRVMHALGVHSMGVRYLVASLTGYATFFGVLRAWLWYVTAEAATDLDPGATPDEVATAIDPDAPLRDAPEGAEPSLATGGSSGTIDPGFVPDLPLGGGSGSSGGGGGGGGFSLDVDGEGLVAVLVIALVALVAAVVFGAAGYIIYQAPAVLGEAAVEAVLATVLARSSRRVTTADWTGSVWSATWKPAVLMTMVVTCAGFMLQGLCPGADTMRGSIRMCVQDKSKR